MSKLTKYILTFIFICIFCFCTLYITGYLSFGGFFDKKYTREELTQNFIEHEPEFYDLVTFFKSNISKNSNYSVSFWKKNSKVTLYLHPNVISPENKIIGASDVKINSPKLDSVLNLLGWTNETLALLSDKLEKTNCSFIKNTEFNDEIIDIAPYQSGWGSFDYRIWDKPIVDSLITIRGNPLGKDSFAIKVVLNYSSAL